MSYSDQDVLRAAAIISRTTGNKRGPKPTTDAASIWKWRKWEDRDGHFKGMEDMGDEFAMSSLREHIGDIGYWLGAKSNPRATYAAHVEKGGKRVITVNKIHDNLSAAKNDAAALASLVPGAKGVVVKTAPHSTARRNPVSEKQALLRAYKAKNTPPHQWAEVRERLLDMGVDLPARGKATRNPPREVVLGHVVVHTKAGYTIPAYKKTFAEMKEVRKWLKAHVAREREAKANPGIRVPRRGSYSLNFYGDAVWDITHSAPVASIKTTLPKGASILAALDDTYWYGGKWNAKIIHWSEADPDRMNGKLLTITIDEWKMLAPVYSHHLESVRDGWSEDTDKKITGYRRARAKTNPPKCRCKK